MLGRDADALDRQEQHARRGRQQRRDARDHAVHDHRVDAERQMRPMLLDRGDRRDDDRARPVERGKIGRLEVGPERGGHSRVVAGLSGAGQGAPSRAPTSESQSFVVQRLAAARGFASKWPRNPGIALRLRPSLRPQAQGVRRLMFSSRINARSIVAPTAFGAALLLIGAVNARAGSDDTGTFSAIGSAIGVTSSDGTIDYRERPKLVVPPDRKSLPEPRAGDDARPPSFPVDQGSPRRQGARAVSGQPVAPDEPSRENLTQPPPAYRHPSKPL